MWHFFFCLFFKPFVMPNSANKSNNNRNAGQGQPKDRVSNTKEQKPNPERSDRKQGRSDNNSGGDTGRTSNQGRKQASGGSAAD
jgi:hypothetical protein